MTTSKKLNDAILKKLYSSNDSHVIEALDYISENGNSDYIPALIDILRTNPENEAGAKVTKILSEIKHSDAVAQLIQFIEDERFGEIQETLVRVCWENGLDFSNKLSTFVDLLINGDYMTAFEAYTVIENTEGKISETSSQEYINLLKEALQEATEERKTLLHAIIQFLPSLIR